MKNTKLKKILNNNKLSVGSWITIPSANIIEILSKFNFDWLCIDIEHNMFNRETISNLVRVIQSFDIAALVRVSSNNEVEIKHVMDAGADGVIVPMVNSVFDANSAFDSVNYPPKGKRGVGLSRAQQYGFEFNKYKDWLKENAVIIAQIEHHKAISNLSEIIKSNFIDGVLIGPYDLSASMGYPGEFERDDVKKLLEKFSTVCKQLEFPHGLHIVEPNKDILKEKLNKGNNLIAYGTDFNFLKKGLRSTDFNNL